MLIVRPSSQASADGIMDASAVQFCARKVSAVSGDARKALDICRYVTSSRFKGAVRFSFRPVTFWFFMVPHLRLVFRRAVEVVESDERKKTSQETDETEGECC